MAIDFPNIFDIEHKNKIYADEFFMEYPMTDML